MTVIPEGYSQVSLDFIGAAVPRGATITFGVGNATDLSPTDIAVAVQADYISDVLGTLTTGITMSQIRVKNGPNDDGPQVVYATNNSGGSGQDTVPPNAAMLVTKVTASGGRRNVGRLFQPGYGEGNMEDGGVWDSTALAAIQLDWTTFKNSLITADLPMVILHGVPLLTPTPVTELRCASRAAGQRRRLRPL